MRHTWNERFSEQAEALGLTDAVEEKARNNQQGWSDNSKMAATFLAGRRHQPRMPRRIPCGRFQIRRANASGPYTHGNQWGCLLTLLHRVVRLSPEI